MAKARRKLAAAMCKRLHELLQCFRVLVGTIIASPSIVDHQVKRGQRKDREEEWGLKWGQACVGLTSQHHARLLTTVQQAAPR